MFESFFELYYKEIFLKNKKREGKEARKNLTSWLVLMGMFGLAFYVTYAVVREEWGIAVTFWVMMILIFFLYIKAQNEDKWEEIKSGLLKKKNEENMESLQNLLKENKYDSLTYIECMIENCKLKIQEEGKWQKVRRIYSSMWGCVKKVLYVICVAVIFLLLEDFGVPKEETTLTNRLISALANIFGTKDTIILIILAGLLIILVTVMASMFFEDIIPEVTNKRKKAQELLLRDLYFVKAELLSK